MVTIILLAVVGSAVWVYFDAKTLEKKDSPIGWAFGVALLWIIVFPWYLATRHTEGP